MFIHFTLRFIEIKISNTEAINKRNKWAMYHGWKFSDPSNNHEQVFSMLKKFKNKNIKIICPLSWKSKITLKKQSHWAQSIFGAKFIPLTEFIEPDEYMKILSDIDIAIMNHDRQQGLGSIG